jgi:hypothetical protein
MPGEEEAVSLLLHEAFPQDVVRIVNLLEMLAFGESLKFLHFFRFVEVVLGVFDFLGELVNH